MDALLEKDEETDSGVYAAYLRAQNDADQLDIARHLDPERYPARVDAARREAERRRVLPVAVYSLEERTVRGLCVAAWLHAAVILLLTLLLTPADAAEPRWPDMDRVPDGTSAAEIMRRALLGGLRAVFVGGAHIGLAPLFLLLLIGWLLLRAPRRAVRVEVKWDALAAVAALAAAFCLAAAPFSHVPELAGLSAMGDTFGARLVTLLVPGGPP